MKAALISIVTLCAIALCLMPVTAPAATQTSDAPSTLVLQCGSAAGDAPVPAPEESHTERVNAAVSAPTPPVPVPEPSTWLLLGGGLLGLLRIARRKHDSI